MKSFLLCALLLVFGSAMAQDITTFPYTQGFEGIAGNLHETYPAGWTSEDLNTVAFGNQTWQIIKNSPSSVNAHTDSTAIHMYSHSSQDNDDWLYTPSIHMTAGEEYILKFWYSAKVIGTYEQIKVHIADTNSSTAMLLDSALWLDDNVNSDVWKQAEVRYTATENGIKHFGFHYYSPQFQFVFLLDDITITTATIGVEENVAENTINIIGNPIEDVLQISLESPLNNEAQLMIYDLQGNLVKNRKISTNAQNISMNLSEVASGLYMIKLQNNEINITRKIVVK